MAITDPGSVLSSSPIHVLLVITKGEIGGAQSHVVELCRVLQGRVCFTAAIGGAPGSHLEQTLQSLEVETVSLPGLRNSLNPLRLLSSVRTLLRHLNRYPADVMHAHSAVAGVVARLAGKLTHTPVVYTVHGFGFKPEAPPMVRWNAWLAEALLAAWTTRMVCVSDHEKDLATQLPMDHSRISVIPNAIEDVAWKSRQDMPLPAIVMVARMAPPKRHDLLMQALGLMAAKDLRPNVTLLGGGPQRAQHQALANLLDLPHVRFVGDVHNVAEQLAQHAIFVLLSDHEGLPMSMIEAMRAGMAIVASRLPGIEELVQHEDSALLVENEPLAVAAALQRLLEDPRLRQRLAQASRLRYEARHQPEAMGERVLEVYEEAPLLPTATWPMTLPKPHRSSLASARARAQRSQLLWANLGVTVLALIWLAGVWLQQRGWVTKDFGRTVVACLVPYFTAAHLLYRGTHLPAAERGGLLLVTTATPFVLTPLGFALLQVPYSRSALLLSYLLTTTWFWLGHRWLFGRRRMKLVYWHAQQAKSLERTLEEMGHAVVQAAGRRLQLLRWPAHWQSDPGLCPPHWLPMGHWLTAPTPARCSGRP